MKKLFVFGTFLLVLTSCSKFTREVKTENNQTSEEVVVQKICTKKINKHTYDFYRCSIKGRVDYRTVNMVHNPECKKCLEIFD